MQIDLKNDSFVFDDAISTNDRQMSNYDSILNTERPNYRPQTPVLGAAFKDRHFSEVDTGGNSNYFDQ